MPDSPSPHGAPATPGTLLHHEPPPLLADSPLRQALDCSDNAIALTNRDRQVVYVNQGFTRLFGFTSDEARGRYLSDVLQGDLRCGGSVGRWGGWHALLKNLTPC